MVGALGVNQRWLFTVVFVLGSFLAGLGGALQMPREPANLQWTSRSIADAFVVVVVGGMGSVPRRVPRGAADRDDQGVLHRLGVDVFGAVPLSAGRSMFLVMAVVLVVRPWGLLGRPQAAARAAAATSRRRCGRRRRAGAARRRRAGRSRCSPRCSLAGAVRAGAADRHPDLRAVRRQPAFHAWGRAAWRSFGHAAYFGLGAYGAALLRASALGLPMEAALLLGAAARRARRAACSAGSACGCPASISRC